MNRFIKLIISILVCAGLIITPQNAKYYSEIFNHDNSKTTLALPSIFQEGVTYDQGNTEHRKIVEVLRKFTKDRIVTNEELFELLLLTIADETTFIGLSKELQLFQEIVNNYNENKDELKKEFTVTFVQDHWEDFIRLGKAAGRNAGVLFKYGLPAMKDFITDKKSLGEEGNILIKYVNKLTEVFTVTFVQDHWEDIVELSNSSGKNAGVLFEYGLPAMKEAYGEDFITKNWNGIVELGKTAGENSYLLFKYGLPAMKEAYGDDFITKNWNGIVELGKTAGENSYLLFKYGLPAMKDIITAENLKKIGKGLISLGISLGGGDVLWLFFKDGLPALIGAYGDEFIKEHWEDIVALGESAGENSYYLFEYGLPAMKDIITAENLKEIGKGLIELDKAAEENSYLLFQYGLPVMKGIITAENLKEIGEVLIELGKASGADSYLLFEYGLTALIGAYGDEFIKEHWEDIVELGKAAGKNVEVLFQYGLPALKEAYGDEFIKEHWEDIVALGKAAGENSYCGLPALIGAYENDFITKNWKGIVELGKTAGENLYLLFEYGLPAMKDIITAENLKEIGKSLIELDKAAGKNSYYLFQYGLPVMKGIITAENLKERGEVLIELGKASGADSYLLFEYGLPALIGAYGDEFIKEHWEDIVELGKAAGKNVEVLFQYGLPAIKKIITDKKSLGEAGKILIEYVNTLTGIDEEDVVDGEDVESVDVVEDIFKLFYYINNNFIIDDNNKFRKIKTQIDEILKNTTKYNQKKIIMLLSEEYIKKIKDENGDIMTHLEFYNKLLKITSKDAYMVIKELKNGIQNDKIDAKLDKDIQGKILVYIKQMKSFNVNMFLVYEKLNNGEKEEFLKMIKEFGVKVLKDEIGGNEWGVFKEQIKKYTPAEDKQQAILLGAIQYVIPTREKSEVTVSKLNSLLEKSAKKGDLREHVPKQLRGEALGQGIFLSGSMQLKKGKTQNEEIEKKIEKLDISKINVNERKKKEIEAKNALIIWLNSIKNKKEYEKKYEECLEKIFEYVKYDTKSQNFLEAIKGKSRYEKLNMWKEFINEDDTGLSKMIKDVLKDKSIELPKREYAKKAKNIRVAAENIGKILKNETTKDVNKIENIKKILSDKCDKDFDTLIKKITGSEDVDEKFKEQIKNIKREGAISVCEITQLIIKSLNDKLNKENPKYELKISGKKKIEFRAVKGMAHILYGVTTGECTYEDTKLWQKENYFLIEMIDQDKEEVCGYMLCYLIDKDDKKALAICGIDPTIELLSQINAEDLYQIIEMTLMRTGRMLGLDEILIAGPGGESNRTKIKNIIKNRGYDSVDLQRSIEFSTDPEYSFREVFVLSRKDIFKRFKNNMEKFIKEIEVLKKKTETKISFYQISQTLGSMSSSIMIPFLEIIREKNEEDIYSQSFEVEKVEKIMNAI